MPKTRYIEDYNKDGTLKEKIPYEVSDEQLYQEQLDKEFNDAHKRAILALKNWSRLTLAQKDTILKNLIKWALWKDGSPPSGRPPISYLATSHPFPLPRIASW